MTTTAIPVAGPRELVHVLLTDGTTVSIRLTTEADLDGLNAMFAALSPNSLRMRFFASGTAAGRDAARRLCEPHPDRIALVAVAGEQERIVGEGEAWRLRADTDAAEAGFTVAEGWRGRGIGTLLLEHLADAARAAGIRTFVAETLAENLAMKRVIASAGLHHSASYEHGGIIFHEIDLTEDDSYLEVVADREFAGSAASLEPLFRPRAVAVVGAGRTRGVGHAIVEHLLAAEFDRPLFAVNPHADEIAGVPCAHSIEALPDRIDLAVLAVPQDALVEAAIACGRHDIRALAVVTSPVAASARTTLKAVCRRYGMRLVGPNCLGVASFDPDLAMDATFGPHTPLAGAAGVGVQSGGVGNAILDHLSRLGIGTASFASLGDKADVSGNDLLAWWSRDPGTELVLLHLESFGNPRKFARYARRVARTKPVLIVAAGRSAAGSRAAASHTAASITPGITREALYRQAGVIATRSVAELVETAALLAAGARPTGHRVAVVSNAGGTGVLGADACTETGLVVPEFSAALRERLSTLLGPAAACGNPVDAGAAAGADLLREAVGMAALSGEVDAVLLLLVPTALADLPSTLAVVVGYDQSTSGDRALAQAGREAAWREASVTVVNAFHGIIASPAGYFPLDVESSLKEAADDIVGSGVNWLRQHYPGMAVDSAVIAGPASDALAEASRDAEILVLGNRGRGGFTGLLLGSVSMRTLTLASCPTMIVRGTPREPADTVVLALDVEDPGEELMDFAFTEASAREARLRVVTVWDVIWNGAVAPDADDDLALAKEHAITDIRSCLERRLNPWHAKHPDVHLEVEVLDGTPSAALTEASKHADLIIAGAHRRGDGHHGMRPGPIVHTLLHHADCPVVVVPRA